MKHILLHFLGLLIAFSCQSQPSDFKTKNNTKTKNMTTTIGKSTQIATFGAGCFWCVEAVFQQLEGVDKVVSGYMGGQPDNPTYKQVCSGQTGHAEVCQISYDSQKISFEELLSAFWQVHDPTTLNRQGADQGTQYRSVVFYHSADQQKIAQNLKDKLNSSGAFKDPIVTQIDAATAFFAAEDYHQNYYNLNGSQPYCSFVIKPKMDKFEKAFAGKLKKNNTKP